LIGKVVEFVKSPVAVLAQRKGSKHHTRAHALARPLMLITSTCWAANIIAGKVALQSVRATALAQFRVTAAAAGFGLLWLCRDRTATPGLKATEWGFLSMTAIFGITLNQLCFVGAIGRTSAAHAGLIVALGPVIVLVLASVMRLETFTLMKSMGTLLALAGVAVLTTGKTASLSGASLAGDVIMLAGTALFAYYTVLLKKIADRYDAFTLNALIFGLGAVFLLPFSLAAVLKVPWRGLPSHAWWGMAFMVVLGTVVSYLIYVFALAELTAARVATFAYLQPIFAIGLGVWLLGEKLTAGVALGGVLILCGVYVAEREVETERATAEISTD
jgi:drug/metabolite transporter (DMT)-like permease